MEGATTKSLLENYKLPNPVKKTRRTERGDLIDYFFERVNADRRNASLKEFPKGSLAFFLSVYTTTNLYLLRIKCESANNWGSMFNYHVFPKKQ